MRKVILMVLLASAIVGCDRPTAAVQQENSKEKEVATSQQETTKAKTFQLDGFKNVKFGMNKEELKGVGFTCGMESSTICNYNGNEKYTLFGREVSSLYVILVENKFNYINVRVDSMTKEEAVKTLMKSLGKPQEFETLSNDGRVMFNWLWISSAKTSIRIVIDPAKPKDVAYLIYGNDASTLGTINMANEWTAQKEKDNATLDPKDY